MLKPSSKVIASSNGLHHLWSSSSAATVLTTPASTKRRRSHRPARTIHHPTSHFRSAHTTSRPHPPNHSDLSWPSTPTPTSLPTPYEIFHQHPSAPYSKRRFYELVKIYHPDSNHPCHQDYHSHHNDPPQSSPSFSTSLTPPFSDFNNTHTHLNIPPSLRLHRYRLIIQAHSILSDPAKRRAYDRYGAGWGSAPDIEGIRRENSERGWRAYADRRDSPAHCATWEDWEGWRRSHAHGTYTNSASEGGGGRGGGGGGNEGSWRGDTTSAGWGGSAWSGFTSRRPPQRPVYVSNGGFVVLIVLFTIVGAVHELGRAGRLHKSFMEQLELRHGEASRELRRAREESRGFEDREGRVERFLRERRADAVLGGLVVGKEGEEGVAGLLESGEEKGRDG